MRYEVIKDGDTFDGQQLIGTYYCERCSTMKPVYTTVATTSDSARLAAEEIARLFGLEKPGWVTVGRIKIDRETETEKFERTSETATDRIAAIIRKYVAAAPADNDAK